MNRGDEHSDLINHGSQSKPRDSLSGKPNPMLQTTDIGYSGASSTEQLRSDLEHSNGRGRSKINIRGMVRDWAMEILWSVLGVVFLAIIVVLLAKFDGKPIDGLSLPSGVTLNTVIAFLATICRTVSVIPIMEGISQLKWNWFASVQRPVKDLLVFDQASRGPWGSLRMIVTIRGRILGTAAAVILVSGLASSTLTQSAVGYKSSLQPSPKFSAEILMSKRYPAWDQYFSDTGQSWTDSLMRTAYQAVFSDVDQEWTRMNPTCGSANCTFNNFETLAVCATVSNITNMLEVREIQNNRDETLFRASLSTGGAELTENMWQTENGFPGYMMNFSSPVPGNAFVPNRTSLAFRSGDDRVNATFSQFHLIYQNPNSSTSDGAHRYRALEILWHFCVNSADVVISSGKDKTDWASTETRLVELTDSILSEKTGAGLFQYILQNSDGSKWFNVTANSLYTELDDKFRDSFAGEYDTQNDSSSTGTEFIKELGVKFFNRVNSNDSTAKIDDTILRNVKRVSDNIGISMTNFIRQAGDPIEGEAKVLVTFIIVRWNWIAFIGTQVGLSIIFLIAVMIHTARLGLPVVKSSNLAELFALQGGESLGHAPGQHVGLKPSIDGSLSGRLIQDGPNWKFQLDRTPLRSDDDIQMGDVGSRN